LLQSLTTTLFSQITNKVTEGLFINAYGYAVFPTVDKGGCMYEASLAGQKYNFTPIADSQWFSPHFRVAILALNITSRLIYF
jgi:hypothetical protein